MDYNDRILFREIYKYNKQSTPVKKEVFYECLRNFRLWDSILTHEVYDKVSSNRHPTCLSTFLFRILRHLHLQPLTESRCESGVFGEGCDHTCTGRKGPDIG